MAKHIHSLLKNFVDPHHQWKEQLLRAWPDIVGSLHEKITIEKITDETVCIGVLSSAWMHELHSMSDLIIKKINEKLDRQRIKQVRFKMKIPAKQTSCPRKIDRTVDTQIDQIRLSADQEQVLSSIKDNELRMYLKRFLVRCTQEI